MPRHRHHSSGFYWSPAHEAARVTVNRWIRSSGAFDGYRVMGEAIDLSLF